MKTATHRRTRARRCVGVRIQLTLLGLLVGCAALWATTTPRPGHKFPQAYLDFLAENPRLFEMKNGWRGKVERARQHRELFFKANRGSSPELLRKRLDVDQVMKMAVTGTVRVPVVPVLFTPNTTPAPPTAVRLDQILFSGPNLPFGTATDYYNEVSYGLLNLTGTVYGYTTLPSADTFYEGTNNGLPPGGRTGNLIQDALNILDATVNFSQYDNDGPDGVPNSGDDDGVVDLISFLHPERGGECGGSNIWAHRWVYRGWFGAAYTTNDAAAGGGWIQIDDYNIQGALTCSNTEMDIGTFAHETGHIFGLPDLYDTQPTSPSAGVGHWSLMASGNWNSQDSPAHISAWEKAELGWLIPILLTSPTNSLSIPQVETNPVAYQMVVGNGEYFLVANRQAVGFDRNLHTCGLAIWHVDQAVTDARRQTNTVNVKQNCGIYVETPGQHYGVALEQADGQCHLERAAGGRGDAGDLFPGSSVNRTFATGTNPASDGYTSGPSLIGVTSISNCSATMTANVNAFPTASVSGPVDVVFLIDNTGSYTDDWPNIQAQMPGANGIVQKLKNNFPDIRYGLALFRDFPFFPFGHLSSGDFAYQVNLALTTSDTAFLSAIANATFPTGGADLPEAQYEAMHQLFFGLGRDLFGDGINGNQVGEIAPSSIGWGSGRHRIIYLLTDASFHDSDTEDYPTGTPDVPTPTLEAEGRSAVRSQIASILASGIGMTIFTMVAEHYSVYVTEGQEQGLIASPDQSVLVQQSSELTDMTGGGVLFVGSDSSDLSAAVDISIDVLNEQPLGECPDGTINFMDFAYLPYGYDFTGVVLAEDANTLITLNEVWLRSEETFTVTPDTVLEFMFASEVAGDFHAIGLDEDEDFGEPRLFKLHGDGSFLPGLGTLDLSPVYLGAGGLYQTFRIPVGAYYTGDGMRLVIVSSAREPWGFDSYFKCVRVYTYVP